LPPREYSLPQKKRFKFIYILGVLVLVTVLLVILLREPLMIKKGEFLVSEDIVQEADVIVVLMGGVPERILHGADLYLEGYADKMVMMRTRSMDDYADLIETRGLKIPETVDINRNIALQLGVPSEDIVVLNAGVDSTWDEAEATGWYLEKKEKESVIVVTSKYHSMRARQTFARVLDDEVRIISSPSPYDTFAPDEWWRHRHHTRSLILEYQKLLNLYFFQW